MSEREKIYQLAASLPEHKLRYVIAYMQGLIADDEDDTAFCEQLCKEYQADPEKDQFISLEEMAKISGVDIDAI